MITRVYGRRDFDRADAPRAAIVAAHGELDSETAHHLARAFGETTDGDYDEKGVRAFADGRVQLSCIATARALRGNR